MDKEQIKTKIEFGKCEDLPIEVRKAYNLPKTGYYKADLGLMAHEIEGVKDTIDQAKYKILNPLVYVKRNDKIYTHQEEDHVFYIEDIEAIINKKVKEAKIILLLELIKECKRDIELHTKIMNKYDSKQHEFYNKRKYMLIQCESELHNLQKKLQRLENE